MPDRKTTLLALYAVALALVCGAYVNSLHNAFHFDDSHVIVENVYVRSLSNIPLFFTDAHTFSSLPQNSTYRPLVSVTLALDYAVGGGLDPLAFHVTQLVLLAVLWAMLCAFFVGLLDVSRPSPWNGRIALFGATLFAVHPVNSETMNLISARSELLSAIGLLGAFLLIQRSPAARRLHLYLLPLAAGALAKAPVVVFAPLLLAYTVLIERKPLRSRAAWREVIPSLVTGAVLLTFLNAMNAKEWKSGGGSAWHYFITQPFAWFHYTRLFVLPAGLTADTDWAPFPHWYDSRAIAGFAFVALLVATIRWCSRRDGLAPVAFGLSWYAIALLPASSFFALAEVINEHRAFFPFIGLVLVAAVLVRALAQRSPRTAMAGALVVLAACAAGTAARNRVWSTEETLWRDTAEKSPRNGRALMNYGLTQMQAGRYAVARDYFERAALLLPGYSTLEINRAIIEGAMDNQAAAESHFKRALELQDDADGHHFYGRWLIEAGRGPEAVAHLERSLALSPGQDEVRTLLLRLLFAAGDSKRVANLAVDTVRIDPSNAAAIAVASGRSPVPAPCTAYKRCFDAGLGAISRNTFLEAALYEREALRLDASSADAWNNLGWSLAQLGFRAQAAEAYRRSLALRPGDERAANNLRLVTAAR